MKRLLLPILAGLFLLAPKTHAALSSSDTLYLKFMEGYYLKEAKVSQLQGYADYQKVTFADLPIKPMAGQEAAIEPYVKNETVQGVDLGAIQSYLWENVVPELNRERSDVTIDMDESGKVTFDGIALPKRTLDVEKAAHMVAHAIENGIQHVNLPVIEEEPVVTVKNQELKDKGIQEAISIGYSNYGNSPANRIHNIETGLNRFNGHLLPPQEELSFVDVLGPVDGSTGFLPELVIKGDRTIPEYGGGLCQISSTAYRAAMMAGLPITERRNHSYLVSYYWPNGLDATIYLPQPDMKFRNETPGHILIQATTVDNEVYYVFYGTKNERQTRLLGPFVHARSGGAATRHEYTTELPPGVTKVLQKPVGGLRISWYHQVEYNPQEQEERGENGFLEHIYSSYTPKGLFIQEGIAAEGEAPPAE